MQTIVNIVHNIEIILRHLAAHDVNAIVVRTADDTPFQYGMIGQIKVVNGNRKVGSPAGGKERIFYKQSKTICADVVKFSFKGFSGFFDRDRTRI